MNLDLNLIDALRDYLNEDHDDHLMGFRGLRSGSAGAKMPFISDIEQGSLSIFWNRFCSCRN